MSHLILFYILYLTCFIKGQVVKVQASNVLETLMPATSNYAWEILDKESPDYELELKNLYQSMKDETKKLEYWNFLESSKSKSYQCAIEETVAGESKLEEREKADTKTPKELLTRLSEVCLYKFEGWWSYEFCYGKHIKQFHVEPISQTEHKVTGEYFLGYAPKGVQAETAQEEDESSFAYKENYSGGTPCDLNVEKRSAVVNFVCDPKNDNHILSILEPSSCVYEVNINTPLLCQHPKYFKENIKEKSNKIFCFEKPLTSEEEIIKNEASINRYSKSKESIMKKAEEILEKAGIKILKEIPIQMKEVKTTLKVTELNQQKPAEKLHVPSEKEKVIERKDRSYEQIAKDYKEWLKRNEKRDKQFKMFDAFTKKDLQRRLQESDQDFQETLQAAQELRGKDGYLEVWKEHRKRSEERDKKEKEIDLFDAWVKFRSDDSSYIAFQDLLDDPKTNEALKSALVQFIKDLKHLDANLEEVQLDDTNDENDDYSTPKIQLEEPEDLDFY